MNRAGRQGMPSWPLFLIAAPAAVAVWSGWVGLGELSGFGLIHPLPGIVPGFRLNTAITLPVGVEAYASFALGAWLRPGTPERAKSFARRSAIGALCLGMLGQVAYHVLAAAHAHRAPWPVVIMVACLPVVTLGFGVALAHLLRVPETVREVAPEPVPALAAKRAPVSSPRVAQPRPGGLTEGQSLSPGLRPERGRRARVTPESAELAFGARLADGDVPSLRDVKSTLKLGTDRAREVRAHLVNVAGVQS